MAAETLSNEGGGATVPFPHLKPPGLVIHALRGDGAEVRAHGWLEWDGTENLQAAVVGLPFDGASTVRSGARHGPDAVRQALALYTTWSSDTRREMTGLKAADIGDVDVVVTDMEGTFSRISDLIAELLWRDIKPIAIGGDHSVTWPILEGVTHALPGKRIGVIHFDAHHDLRESHFGAESSGVPFRKALGFEGRPIRGRNLVQIGMLEFANAPVHAAFAEEEQISVIPALEVRRRGMDAVLDQAIDRAGDGTDSIYVSVDIDCVDQSQAPGTAAPNPLGLDGRDVALAVRRLAALPTFTGLDVVEISPPLDVNGITANLGAMLVLNALFGVHASQPQTEQD